MSQETQNDPSVDQGSIPDDPLTGHSYDGIEEFDNPLPGWWKWLFVASIIFAFPYAAFYHMGASGRTLTDSYDRALAHNMQMQFAEIGEVKPDRETVVKFLGRPNWLAFGKTLYKTNCTSCHGSDGGGLVGPNLCDEHYKNVNEIEDILRVLQKGAGGGAMPAWNNRLSTNEIVLLSSYVASLRGTEPASPKPPLGNKIAPWPEPEPEEVTENDSSGDGEVEKIEES